MEGRNLVIRVYTFENLTFDIKICMIILLFEHNLIEPTACLTGVQNKVNLTSASYDLLLNQYIL